MDLKEYRKKLIGNEQERAVSPVIGVILMVAITVILAAVIAAFVMDMGSSIGSEANAGVNVNVDEPSDEFLVTWTSEGNSDHINATVEYTASGTAGDAENTESEVISNVGSSESWSATDLVDVLDDGTDDVDEVSGTITVTGEIEGGATTVITTQSFTFETDDNFGSADLSS